MVILQAFGNFWSLIASSGFVVQLVLLILLGFSVLSWAITYRKYSLFREARRQSQGFHSYFRANSSLSAIHAECEQFPKSPLAGIFKAAYYELQQEIEAGPEPSAVVRNWSGMQRSMRRAAQIEMTALESSLNWMGTTAAVTPFIGLFGTVWGIMNSFRAIAASENTNLAVVAPGIAEALFATALGLIAAIPAKVFYDMYLTDLDKYGGRLEGYADELSAILGRKLNKDG